jgi:hypothetical protein
MQTDAMDDGPVWQKVEAELKVTPPVADDAIDRVMARVHTMRMEPAVPKTTQRSFPGWIMRRHTFSVTPLHALAASLLIALGTYAMLRGHRVQDAASPGLGSRPATVAGPLTATSRAPVGGPASASDQLQPTQFIFVAKDAHAVTIAGDFNDWNATSAPMQRLPNGVWSIVVPLAPGRHVYSFVVDGRRWVPDAAAPRAPENDFGAESSIVLVERT